MNDRDHKKLMNAGFEIIRLDEDNLRIKRKTEILSWKTLEQGFKNKAALKRHMKKLLELNFVVED